jgi:catechol 2,3-dioxygenase-like lactoylglutathione lyase family enzyme
MLTAHLGLVLLFVANPQKSSLFYQELLEMKPVEQSPTFAMFALKNGVMLGLWSKYTAEPRVEAPAGALEVCFPTDDVDALYEAWGKKEVTIAQKPTDMDFGRTFVALDPDGHRIRIYKLSEEQK